MADLKWAAGNFERPYKRANVTRQSEESRTIFSTAAAHALLAERKDYKNCCKALTIKTSSILGWAPRQRSCGKILPVARRPMRRQKLLLKVAERIALPLRIIVWLHLRRSLLTPRLRIRVWSKVLLALMRTLISRRRAYKIHRHVSSKLNKRQSWIAKTYLRFRNIVPDRLRPQRKR